MFAYLLGGGDEVLKAQDGPFKCKICNSFRGLRPPGPPYWPLPRNTFVRPIAGPKFPAAATTFTLTAFCSQFLSGPEPSLNNELILTLHYSCMGCGCGHCICSKVKNNYIWPWYKNGFLCPRHCLGDGPNSKNISLFSDIKSSVFGEVSA